VSGREWGKPALNLATRSGGRLNLRDRLTLAAAHIVLGTAGKRTRDRIRDDLLDAADRWADTLRTEGRTTPVVRKWDER
jgi:hypothetical protein